jgi:hypothetical protein
VLRRGESLKKKDFPPAPGSKQRSLVDRLIKPAEANPITTPVAGPR